MTDRVHTTAPVRRRSRQLLPRLAAERPNFRLEDLPTGDGTAGWYVDDYCGALPGEPAGRPQQLGPFDVACRLLDAYAMADPSMLRAAYYLDTPLAGRDMVLEGRFIGLRFPMGVRIGEVIDTEREIDGRPVRVHGWSYRTLGSHLERGQMDWEIWKWLDTGGIEFRLHAVSRRAPISNPIVRLGFRLFGRWTQVRFVRRALVRMNELVAVTCGVAPAGRACVETSPTSTAILRAPRGRS